MNNLTFHNVCGYCLGTHKSTAEKYGRDLAVLAGRAKWIRGYSMPDWNAHRIAKKIGFKTAVGAWLGGDLSLNESEFSHLVAEAKRGYADIAIVGSEVLLRKELAGSELAGYAARFKKEVPGIPVTVCDDIDDLLMHPEVLDACDFIGAHIYPYWHGISIENSLWWLIERYHRLEKFSGKEVLIAETGWPSGGNTVGEAVPNPENASRYFKSFVEWADENRVRYFYFASFDESWKAEHEGPQGAHWGRWFEDGTEK